MSRSYKKVPISKDCPKSSKRNKIIANQTLRHTMSKLIGEDNLIKGNKYKRLYPQWEIHDYVSYYPKSEAIRDWDIEEKELAHGDNRHGYRFGYLHDRYGTKSNWLAHWKKMMVRK